MKIEITIAQFMLLKDIVEMLSGINRASSVTANIEVNGGFGKGTARYNAHEHDAKIRIDLEAQ